MLWVKGGHFLPVSLPLQKKLLRSSAIKSSCRERVSVKACAVSVSLCAVSVENDKLWTSLLVLHLTFHPLSLFSVPDLTSCDGRGFGFLRFLANVLRCFI